MTDQIPAAAYADAWEAERATRDGSELEPALGGDPIESVADAIVEGVRLAAVVQVATERTADLKAYVLAELGRPGASEELDGVGKALVTDPNKRAEVVDDDAFRAWALVDRPDRAQTVRRVNAHAIERALAGDRDVEEYGVAKLSDRLAAILDEIEGAVTLDVVIDAKLAEDERKAGTEHRLDDGTIGVVDETGERIPGVEVRKASKPTPQIKPDKAAVAAIVEQIVGRLTPVPAIEEGDDA